MKAAMMVTLGEEGLKETWQAEFPPTTTCVHCKAEARIGFVAHEGGGEGQQYVCALHSNEPPNKLWLHDAVAVAVYFCTCCLQPSALYNQA